MIKFDINEIKKGQYLPKSEFHHYFNDEWEKLSDNFLKYEALQYYDEGTESPFHDFVKRDYTKFLEKLVAFRKEDKPFYETAQARGTSFVRLHSIALPLNDYLKYEFNSYLFSKKLGENILVIKEEDVKNKIDFLPLDFMVFDQRCALVQDYVNGQLKGAWLITEKELIKNLTLLFNELSDQAVAFENFYKGLPEVLKLMETGDAIFK